VIAIDLPKYGKSKAAQVPEDTDEFIGSWFDDRFVLLSPSMSGGYSLPFLMNKSDRLAGFIPVAPVSTEKYSVDKYHSVTGYRLFSCNHLVEKIV